MKPYLTLMREDAPQREHDLDTIGYLLALQVTPADVQERSQAALLTGEVQAAMRNTVEVTFVDQGYMGESVAQEAAQNGI